MIPHSLTLDPVGHREHLGSLPTHPQDAHIVCSMVTLDENPDVSGVLKKKLQHI